MMPLLGISRFNYSHDGSKEIHRFGPNLARIPQFSLFQMVTSTTVVRIVESLFWGRKYYYSFSNLSKKVEFEKPTNQVMTSENMLMREARSKTLVE